jgi:hypothetical protein
MTSSTAIMPDFHVPSSSNGDSHAIEQVLTVITRRTNESKNGALIKAMAQLRGK